VKLNNKILTELEEVAPTLAKLDKVNFYQVQEGYFENSQSKIAELVEKSAMQEDVLPSALSAIDKKQLYPAPAAVYFKSFSEALIAKVHAEEVEEELSYALPVLQHVPKKSLYKVPAAYFASFPEKIIKLATKKAPGSSLTHWGSVWSSVGDVVFAFISRPRYSFAMASVVGMIVCIVLVTNTKTSALTEEDRIFAQMQQIPDADLHHYIDKNRDEFDERTILHNINDVEFTHYFDKPEQVTPHIENHAKGNANDEPTNDDILD
jgi:hypothetical protein